ncbi:hypothetical protein [Cellvibrio sp.]
MIHISVNETDEEIADKFLKTAFAMAIGLGGFIYFMQTQKEISNWAFGLPIAAFVFCMGISIYHKKRNSFTYLLVDDEKLVYEDSKTSTTLPLSSIQKVAVEKYWSSEQSHFEFYLCTDAEKFRVPRLNTVTDIQIIKTIIKVKPEIDSTEAEKIFRL